MLKTLAKKAILVLITSTSQAWYLQPSPYRVRKTATTRRHFKKNINKSNPLSKGKIRTDALFQQNLKSREESPGRFPSEQQVKFNLPSLLTQSTSRPAACPLPQ